MATHMLTATIPDDFAGRAASESSGRRLLIAVAVAAAAVRLAAISVVGLDHFSGWNLGWEAGSVARSIVAGEGYSSPFLGVYGPSGPTAWVSPGYPLLISAALLVTGGSEPVAAAIMLAINALAGAFTCLAFFRLGSRCFNLAAGWIAAVLFAIYPASIFYSSWFIWPTSLSVCFLISFLAWIYAPPGREPKTLLVGLVVGLFCLVDPKNALLLPIWWTTRFAHDWRHPIQALPSGLRAAAVAALVLSPWIAFTAVNMGKPMLRSNLGVELRRGNGPEAWIAYNDPGYATIFHPGKLDAEFERYARLGELEYAAVSQKEALQFINEHPDRFLLLAADRFQRIWLGDSKRSEQGAVGLFKLWSLRLVVTAGLLGIVVAWRSGFSIAPLLAVLILYPLPYYLTHAHRRYGFPVEIVLLLFGSFLLSRLPWFSSQHD